ncbi:MAG: multidrug transporter [Candidatus Aenigmarchaeota archaeon]|nr:multidrug transporter [Candidatus Aenigmarchaeota archaeon]
MAIGGGALIGMGVGFLINNIVAGLFIGIGCGLVVAALLMRKQTS